MRHRIQASQAVKTDKPMSLPDLLGADVKAWVFGAVARGAPKTSRVLDVYVAGPAAEKLEGRFFGKRPAVLYAGQVYPIRLIGPAKISEALFVKEHPEAFEII
jgi:hypothetical protein